MKLAIFQDMIGSLAWKLLAAFLLIYINQKKKKKKNSVKVVKL